MRISIIDDHPVFRGGLQAILTAEFPDASFLQSGRLAGFDLTLEPDLLLLDLFLPDFDPLSEFPAIRQRLSQTAIVLLSMTEDNTLANALVKKGANGFIHKSRSSAQIIQALRAVLTGEVVWLPARARREGTSDVLTARQMDVLALIAEGLTNKEIARDLDISHHTVRFHVSSVLAQLGVKSRSAAAAAARDFLTGRNLKQ